MVLGNGIAQIASGKNQGGDGLHPAFAYMTPPHAFRDHAQRHAFEEATTELLFDICWQVAGIQANSDRMAAPIKVMQDKKTPTRAVLSTTSIISSIWNGPVLS